MPTDPPFLQRLHVLFRRLHSLTGIVPIGVFLLVHLLTNSSVVWGSFALRHPGPEDLGGVAYFNEEVAWLNSQIPHLLLVEITLWASIAFHSILGVVYALTGSNNVARYRFAANKRYALQRLSGYVGILFIFYHVATLRWGWTFLVPGGTRWEYQFSASTLALALRGGQGWTAAGFLVSAFYMLGVSLLIFHFANGLWSAAITWGLTVSATAQKRWGQVCTVLGIAMLAMGWAAVIGFATLNPEKARQAEEHRAPAPVVEVTK